MGLEFREVAKEITSALNLGEDEGKIDALAGSLEDAAIKSFGHSSELHTKLVSSLNQSSLLQSNRVKEFLDGERGGGTIITGELSPLQKEALERSMSPEQMESLGLARNTEMPGCMACSFSSADAGAGAVSGGGSNSMPSSKPSTFSIADIDSLAILPVPLPLPLPRCRYSAVAVKQPTSSRSSCACSLTDVAEASRTCSSQVANWPCPPCVLVATWLHLAVQVATWLKTTQPDSYQDACKTSR